MTTYVPDDTLVDGIINELAAVAGNIQGVGRIYGDATPDGPPEDNSVLFPLKDFDLIDDTNGKGLVKLTFSIHHVHRRKNFAQNLKDCYRYVIPFILAYSDWANQDLNGLAQSVTVEKGGVLQFVEAGMPYVALLTNVTIITEINLYTSPN